MALIVNRSRIILSEISEVKHQLIIPNKIIYIGYSTQSLRKNQLIYEVHEAITGKILHIGQLAIFGTRFLTPFVRYKGNTFIIMVITSCRKQVQLHDFEHDTRIQLIKSIDYKDFQNQASKQKYGMSYHNDAITIVEMTETNSLNILVRKYTSEKADCTYRVVSFDPMPQLFFSSGHTYLFNKSQLTLLSPKLEPQFYEIPNWQQFKIVAVNDLIIATYDIERQFFSMTPHGKIFQLGCQITALAVHDVYVCTIVDSSHAKKLKIMQFNNSEAKYHVVGELPIPTQCQNKILFGEWIKLSLKGQTENQRQILVVTWDEEKHQENRKVLSNLKQIKFSNNVEQNE